MEAATHQATVEGGAPQRASLAVVFGVAGGFLVLLACIGTLVGFGPRTTPAEASLAEHYEVGELPFGFSIHPDLFLLPSAEQVYVLNGEDFAPVESKDVEAAVGEQETEEKESEEGDKSEHGKVDWSAMQSLNDDSPPAQLFLVEYPIASAEKVIEQQFRDVQWKQLAEIEADGGRSAVDGGKLEWNGFMADYVHQREFRPGLRFSDQVRVNLSVGGKCWIAYAVWPEQHAGSTEPVKELLASLRPIE